MIFVYGLLPVTYAKHPYSKETCVPRYMIYLMGRKWNWFDPATDLLLNDMIFATWREVDQDAPPGKPLAAVYRGTRGNWCIDRQQNDRFGIFPLVGRWLDPQLISSDSLGPHKNSNYKGLFHETDSHCSLYKKLINYNALVATTPEDILTPCRTRGDGELSLSADGQVGSYSVALGEFPDDMWDDYFRDQLLKKYKQIQDNKLGIPGS